MKHAFAIGSVVSVFAFIFFAIVVLSSSDRNKPATGLVFEHHFFDGGIIEDPSHRIIRHRFPFRNHGPDVLNIKDTRTTCGCTIPTISDQSLAPGESGFIDVDLHLGNAGRIEKPILIISDSPTSPDRLVIAGTFRPRVIIRADPETLVLDLPQDSKRYTGTFDIHVLSMDPAPPGTATEWRSDASFVTAYLTETEKTEWRNHLGYYRTTFRFKTVSDSHAPSSFSDTLGINFIPDRFGSINIAIKSPKPSM